MKALIGLTGGIGSGKSLAAALFAELGIASVDADQIAREVVQPGEPALDAIQRAFGDQALLADGTLNRSWMRQRVFADDQLRRQLEAITHPAIRSRLLAKVQALQSVYALLVSPLLLESDQHKMVDAIIVVDVPESLQTERAATRDGCSPAQIQAIMAAQLPRHERLLKADFVLDNSADRDHLKQQINELHQHLLHQWL